MHQYKLILLLLSVIFVLSLLAGCSTPPLGEAFTEEAVSSAAADIVSMVNARNYADVHAAFTEVLQGALSEKELSDVFDPILDKLGAGESAKKLLVYGTSDKTSGEPYAVAVVVFKYANGNAQFTLSFDRDYRLNGIYIK